MGRELGTLSDLVSGEELSGEALVPQQFAGIQFGEEKTTFDVKIKPHSYRVFHGQ